MGCFGSKSPISDMLDSIDQNDINAVQNILATGHLLYSTLSKTDKQKISNLSLVLLNPNSKVVDPKDDFPAPPVLVRQQATL